MYTVMSFYPNFIPMSGGSRLFLPPLLGLTLFIGGFVAFTDYDNHPRFHLDMKKKYSDTVLITCNSRQSHRIQRVKHHNIDCLIKKGYKIEEPVYLYGPVKESVSIQKQDIQVEGLLRDCKECNTYTAIDYDYSTFFSDKEKDSTKQLSWISCNVRRQLT